jgi:hypothetical protein
VSIGAGPLHLAAALLVAWLTVAAWPAHAEPEPRKTVGEQHHREELAVDVKFRPGVALDEPLLLLPPELRKQVSNAAPLVTLDPSELDRIGAARMARWFRLELLPAADVDAFLAALRQLESVETAERTPKPAPMGS